MSRKIGIVLYQQRLLGDIPAMDKGSIRSVQPDFVCLPEYFFVTEDRRDHRGEAARLGENLDKLRRWSVELDTVLIGGTVVEKVGLQYFNTSYVFDRGEEVARYSKVHLFRGEIRSGLTPGREFKAFDVRGVRVGLLICADVLYADSFLAMKGFGCDIVFVPTTSPFKEETVETKYGRDQEIFVQGARTAGACVAKCCAVGTIFGSHLQGRSLVASPNGIVRRVQPDEESVTMILHQNLLLDDLQTVRRP